MSKGKPESKIQTEVLRYLQEQGVFAWRQNNQPLWDRHLNNGYGAYRSHAGILGVPDIIAIINGRFTGFEVKTPQGKQSPDQILFERRCKRAGGAYYVVRSVSDVQEALATITKATQ